MSKKFKNYCAVLSFIAVTVVIAIVIFVTEKNEVENPTYAEVDVSTFSVGQEKVIDIAPSQGLKIAMCSNSAGYAEVSVASQDCENSLMQVQFGNPSPVAMAREGNYGRKEAIPPQHEACKATIRLTKSKY